MNVSESAPLGTIAKLKRVKQERDELAAHVERLHQALNDQLNDCINFGDGQLTAYIQASSAQALEQTPATSLARRDLLKQAEGFEALADKLVWGVVVDHLLEAAKDLRQQAKELSDD